MMDIEEVYQRIIELKKSFADTRKGLAGKLKIINLINSINKWMPSDYKGIAPCQESVRYNAKLSEFFTTPSRKVVVHSADPEKGDQTFEQATMWFKDDNTLVFDWSRSFKVAHHLQGATHRLPVVLCLGGDPLYSLLAPMRFNQLIDKYLIAAFIRDKTLQLAPCFTQELKVPADCDIVIEGYIQKNEEFEERGPQFHTTCLSQRKKHLFPTLACDRFAEKIYLASLQTFICEDIVDLQLPEEGEYNGCAVVKTNTLPEGQKDLLINSLWGSNELSDYDKIVLSDLSGSATTYQRPKHHDQ